MTLALLFALATAPKLPKLAVIPRPGPTVCVQALVGVPSLNATDRAALEILVSDQAKQTQDYTAAQVNGFCAAGGAPRSEVTADHVRVWLTVNKVDLKIGLRLMRSILNKPLVGDSENLITVSDRLDCRNPVFWRQAMYPERLPYTAVTTRHLQSILFRLYRPENIALLVAGATTEEDAAQALSGEWESWEEPLRVSQPFGAQNAKAWPRPNAQATLAAFISPPKPATAAQVHAQLLAASMLGLGKGSSVFRVLRLQQNLSYRQEAYLWPDPAGFSLRLVLAYLPAPDEAKQFEAGLKALQADVTEWTEDDRIRAIALLNAGFGGGYDQFPVAFRPMGGIPQSQEDADFWGMYWKFKTGLAWDTESELEALKTLSLDTVKAYAKDELGKMKLWLLSGG